MLLWKNRVLSRRPSLIISLTNQDEGIVAIPMASFVRLIHLLPPVRAHPSVPWLEPSVVGAEAEAIQYGRGKVAEQKSRGFVTSRVPFARVPSLTSAGLVSRRQQTETIV
jgi:hypothetical protein